jgi:hypothetical protein
MTKRKKDYSHLPERYRPENLPKFKVEFVENTYTVFCEGKKLWSGHIKEAGIRNEDSNATRLDKVTGLIAAYLVKRQ